MTEPFVRPDVRAFLDYVNMSSAPRVHEVEPPQAREMTRAMRHLAEVDTGPIAVMRDVAMPDSPVSVRLFDARESRLPGPVLVFFHGGGFVIGDLDTYEALCAEMARVLDLPVVSVDYRLSPEHAWPAAPDDCEAAARWVAGNPAELGVKATSLVLAGDSAGGTLTVVTSIALRDAPAAVPVIAQWPIYPAVDMAAGHRSFDVYGSGYFLTKEAMVWFSRCYQADATHWRATPMIADTAGMPPTLVLTAGLDPLVDQGRAYAGKLIAAGVPTIYREAAGTIHGFINIRRAIPSGEGDLQGALAVLKPMILEAEANRVMAQAARA